jgi:methylmalonyl-CoA mutase N-terminal domain/subunit
MRATDDTATDQAPTATTTSGVPLKSAYTPADVNGLQYDTQIGDPGQFPFTRGTRGEGYRDKKWTVRQVMGLGTAEETNQRLRYLLKEGQTGVSLTGMGYAPFDSTDPRSLGLVGRGGVWIDTLADMEDVFKGIDMRSVSINQTGNSIPAFCMIIGAAKRQGVPLDQLSGTIQNYVLPWGDPPEYRGNHYIDIIEFCSTHAPRWNHSSISVRNTREYGISAAQEMAFGLYQGFIAVAAACERGADPNRVAERVTFFLNAENDMLEEIAKFRAMRRMWAQLVRGRLNVTDDRACQLRFHVQTSGVSLTAQQPLNNIVRATIHALAAVFGGAQSMSVNAFDEVVSIPSELAQTLSVRTQQIIQMESGVANVTDPWGGSYMMETLTNQVQEKALELFDELLTMEPKKAWEHMSASSREAAYHRQQLIDSGERPVVGVNCFVAEDEPELDFGDRQRGAPDYDPAWRDKQIARVERVKAERDVAQWEAARRRLVDAYRAREAIVAPTLEAAEAYMSIGEMCEALGEVNGQEELRKRGGFVIRLY